MVQVNIINPSVELITPIDTLLEYPKLIEQAGRTCYKSENRITEDSCEKFIKLLIKRGHTSVLEHCSVTYKVICSRSCSHQLVRHRLGSYSQASQRFVDYKNGIFEAILPPKIIENELLLQKAMNILEVSCQCYNELRNNGIKPEDSRFVLPNAISTELAVTFNIRQWRHVFFERGLNPHAQWEIKYIVRNILSDLNKHIPIFFFDITSELFDKIE